MVTMSDLELPEFLDRRKNPRDTDADFARARERRREENRALIPAKSEEISQPLPSTEEAPPGPGQRQTPP